MQLDSKQCLLPVDDDEIEIASTNCVLIVMHGMNNNDASYQRVIGFVSCLQINTKQGVIDVRLVHDGDHRLSCDEDLKKAQRCLSTFF